MKTFVLDSVKTHYFVLADFEKENKFVQLIQIDKKNSQVNAMVLHQEPNSTLVNARLELFLPTHEKILKALQFSKTSDVEVDPYKIPITQINNTKSDLNNDMFMVSIVETFLQWATAPPDQRKTTVTNHIIKYKDSLDEYIQEVTFNLQKQKILR